MPITLEQRRTALQHASEIRLARAALRKAINEGRVSAASVILDPPREAATWPVRDLLMAQKRWADRRAGRLLRAAMIGELKPVGALTDRQRRTLAEALGHRGDRP